MKLILTSMVALAMAGAPLMARQEPQEDKDKPKKEEPKKPEPKAKPDAKPKQEPQPKPDEKQQPKPDQKADKERQKQDEKQQREETRPAPQKQSAQQGREQGGQGRGPARGGQRIPEERFRTSFGREHHFHVRRDQRFQYSGYWFEVAQPWPEAWVFDDECYVEEDGDTYYLVDAIHPDIRVMVIVVEG